MYQKNQLLEVDITDITNDGEGVGKLDGYTFFIKDALIGDRVQFIVTKVKKTYGYGKVKTVISPSEYRIKAKCPDARRCGGCQIQELSYERQLKFKRDKVINNLIRLGGFEREFLESIEEPMMGMKDDCFRYRNKAQFPVGYDKEGNLIAGFYAGRTHNIMPIDDCMIGAYENKSILQAILEWMKRYGISAYDEVMHKGVVRHVLIRKGFASGELMVCLVINADTLPKGKELINRLLSVAKIQSISYSINKEKTNVIMGNGYKTLYGSDTITDSIGNLEFKISPLSFYQVNPIQTRMLYEKALEYADLGGSETVWDLYCGIGTISLFLAKKAGHVYGVEIVPQAIEDAKENAKINKLNNTDFYVGKAEEVIDRLWEKNKDSKEGTDVYRMTHPDVIVVDPPRKGCDEQCLSTIIKMSPDRIVYVSCDSATLARDLRLLCDNGYVLKAFTPCDMFPHTVHVETIVCLSKGDVKSKKIRVEFSLEDMDTDGFKKGATYNAIRDWIKAKYGYRVTNLNIAQVKQKHGIIERENYNKPKSPDNKQPGCPDEKVKAIEDAMRHFQMI